MSRSIFVFGWSRVNLYARGRRSRNVARALIDLNILIFKRITKLFELAQAMREVILSLLIVDRRRLRCIVLLALNSTVERVFICSSHKEM